MLPVEPSIFQRWHADFISMPKVGEWNYVLILVDSFSLFSILLPTKTTSAEETARLLFDHLFMVFGCKRLLTDRGANFRSKLVSELCRLLGVKQMYTSSMHPQTNSRCEAYNKNLLSSLRTHCQGSPELPNLLSSIGHTFRASVVSSFGWQIFGLRKFSLDFTYNIEDLKRKHSSEPNKSVIVNRQCGVKN